jgi:hypothetical protein
MIKLIKNVKKGWFIEKRKLHRCNRCSKFYYVNWHRKNSNHSDMCEECQKEMDRILKLRKGGKHWEVVIKRDYKIIE